MILGPTGSGKELVARALHHCSPRASKVLHTINCSQYEGALAESRFFGHSRAPSPGPAARPADRFTPGAWWSSAASKYAGGHLSPRIDRG
ncbi:MAG: sigma 54-interacting transcriptional regulator, partial [Deltaproteobacteria bacterium]|nr:sigma 54-interacting transcriptional regulator [Deltaproteobacteria bacterium]